MIVCQFISVEDEEPDLIVSFSCAREVDDQDDDIMIHRTPKYETLMPEEERGAHVSVGYDSDEINVLETITIRGRTITVQGGAVSESRDCGRVDEKEWKRMIKVLREMNFDHCIRMDIA